VLLHSNAEAVFGETVKPTVGTLYVLNVVQLQSNY